jgi:hypothetical protein
VGGSGTLLCSAASYWPLQPKVAEFLLIIYHLLYSGMGVSFPSYTTPLLFFELQHMCSSIFSKFSNSLDYIFKSKVHEILAGRKQIPKILFSN